MLVLGLCQGGWCGTWYFITIMFTHWTMKWACPTNAWSEHIEHLNDPWLDLSASIGYCAVKLSLTWPWSELGRRKYRVNTSKTDHGDWHSIMMTVIWTLEPQCDLHSHELNVSNTGRGTKKLNDLPVSQQKKGQYWLNLFGGYYNALLLNLLHHWHVMISKPPVTFWYPWGT